MLGAPASSTKEFSVGCSYPKPSCFFLFTWFELGSDWSRYEEKSAGWRRRTRISVLLGSPPLFDNADGPIWDLGESCFFCNPKKFLKAARPKAPFFRASLKWNCGTYPNYDATCLYCHLINLFKSNEGTSCRKSARFVRRVKNKGKVRRGSAQA